MVDDAEVLIEEYNPGWAAAYEREREELETLLAPWVVEFHHVGSTAVPGLAAEPVIDILGGVKSLEDSKPSIEVLQSAGWCYFPYQPDIKHWFCKPSPAFRTHHLHLQPVAGRDFADKIAFRDHLRSEPADALRYEELKRSLAKRFRGDREGLHGGQVELHCRDTCHRRSTLDPRREARAEVSVLNDRGSTLRTQDLGRLSGNGVGLLMHEWTCNGRDQHSIKVPPGIYCVRVTAADRNRSRKPRHEGHTKAPMSCAVVT